MTPIDTHFDELMPYPEQVRIGATAREPEDMRVMRVLAEYEELREWRDKVLSTKPGDVYVGGPWDGRRQLTPPQPGGLVRVPVDRPRSALLDLNARNEPRQSALYRIQSLYFGPDMVDTFYVHEPIGEAKAIKMLVDGYGRPVKTL